MSNHDKIRKHVTTRKSTRWCPRTLDLVWRISSVQYCEALSGAPFPLIYGQVTLQFHIHHNHHLQLPFNVGNPATITIGWYGPSNYGLGYAVYVMIRNIMAAEPCHNSSYTLVTVEAHVILGHMMNWSLVGAELWAYPPRHIRYIQPHAFLLPFYQAMEYDVTDVATIDMVFSANTTLLWTIDCVQHCYAYYMYINLPQLLHPPPLLSKSYPQYPSNFHAFSPYRLLQPSIRGHDIWEDVYRADTEMARHAAMYMMVLYYQYGMMAPEDVLPYVMGRS